jgi:hypothetical protein
MTAGGKFSNVSYHETFLLMTLHCKKYETVGLGQKYVLDMSSRGFEPCM